MSDGGGGAKVIEFKRPKRELCGWCQKPLEKGERYFSVMTPDGPKTVHARCMG